MNLGRARNEGRHFLSVFFCFIEPAAFQLERVGWEPLTGPKPSENPQTNSTEEFLVVVVVEKRKKIDYSVLLFAAKIKSNQIEEKE